MNLVDFFKALGDETRLRIIHLLLHSRFLRVMDLVEVLQLPQSTVSRHLAMLKRMGWVEDRRVDIWVHYRLNRELSAALLTALKEIFTDQLTFQNDLRRLKQRERSDTGSPVP
ncbi:MAG: metalloregulator ArsR/SmtB family transcription factor [Calditrichaeota bacterium]|nr:metalloregulator ArsR/SmtB family transcription factor [Calditrichota bacterium]